MLRRNFLSTGALGVATGAGVAVGPLRQLGAGGLARVQVSSSEHQVSGLSAGEHTLWSYAEAGPQCGQMNSPTAALVHEERAYVCNRGNSEVVVLNSEGELLTVIGEYGGGSGELRYPLGIAMLGGSLFVADTFNHRVQRFGLHGEWQDVIGTFGFGIGQFNAPSALRSVEGQYLEVWDKGNGRIQRFTADGEFLRVPGDTGVGLEGEASALSWGQA